MTSRRATIADVAREAAVSPSTASVVFSGKTPVSDATRQRVLDAAASLGYTGPDPRAASLRRGRSGIVGVVVGSTLNHLFLDPVQRLMMDGLAEAVAPFGAGLLLLRSSPEIENAPTLLTVPVDAAVPRESVFEWNFDKAFHVSPFMPMQRDYRWRFQPPGAQLRVHMDVLSQGESEFDATLVLERKPLDAATLSRCLRRYPAMTLRVVAAIHWQALRLWFKRVPFHSHPGPAAPQHPPQHRATPRTP